MTREELEVSDTWTRAPYTKECSCGTFNIVYTQPDDRPEYYTQIFISCTNPECNQLVEFYLPVN